MKDIQIKKMQSDDDFYVELRKICLDWQQKGISEEVKDIICDIIFPIPFLATLSSPGRE